MQQIFDEHLYTPELKQALKGLSRWKTNATITCELLTPKEFFKLLQQVSPNLYKYVVTWFNKDPEHLKRCESIREAIKNQTLLPIPYITAARIFDVFVADGCHRMYVCEQLFGSNTKVPVLVITPTKKEDTI